MSFLTNLQYVGRSNKKPRAGDIFAMRLPSGESLYGMVVLPEQPREHAPMPLAILIYIYDLVSKNQTSDYTALTPSRLLIPPVWTNTKGWTVGVFKTVGERQIGKADVLPRHCFERPMLRPGPVYVDEHGVEIESRVEPCGSWSLASYRAIDDRISEALGIPLASAADR
jgi:hypothetical protein